MKKILLFIIIVISVNAKAQIDTIGIFKATGLTHIVGNDTMVLDTEAEIIFIDCNYEYKPYYEFVVRDNKNPKFSDKYVLPYEYKEEQSTLELRLITGQGFNRETKETHKFWVKNQRSDKVEKKWTKEKGWEIIEGYDEWAFIFYTPNHFIYYIAE